MGGQLSQISLCFKTISSSLPTDFGTSEYFKNTREPFSVTLAGEKLIILISTQDVAAAYKNTVSLSYDIFVKDRFFSFEISSDAVHKMYQKPEEFFQSEDGNEVSTFFQNNNFLQKPLCHFQNDSYKQQFHSGKN